MRSAVRTATGAITRYISLRAADELERLFASEIGRAGEAQRIQIANYRSIGEMDFQFPDSNLPVLVGANNAGKSNIVRAIDAICGEGGSGRATSPDQQVREDLWGVFT